VLPASGSEKRSTGGPPEGPTDHRPPDLASALAVRHGQRRPIGGAWPLAGLRALALSTSWLSPCGAGCWRRIVAADLRRGILMHYSHSLNAKELQTPGDQKPRISRAFLDGHGWFRTADLSRVKSTAADAACCAPPPILVFARVDRAERPASAALCCSLALPSRFQSRRLLWLLDHLPHRITRADITLILT
jgi:hypothetical protein